MLPLLRGPAHVVEVQVGEHHVGDVGGCTPWAARLSRNAPPLKAPVDGADARVDEHDAVAGAHEEAAELELDHAVGGEERPVRLPLLVGGADERLGGTEVRGAVVQRRDVDLTHSHPPIFAKIRQVTSIDLLDAGAVDAIAGLCRRSLADPPSPDEVAAVLFSDDRAALVRGDPDVGVVATGEADGNGFVKLLVVDPAHRRQGHGRALLDAAETDLAGAAVDHRRHRRALLPVPRVSRRGRSALLCLLERRRYARRDTAFNMSVGLDALPPDRGDTTTATAGRPRRGGDVVGRALAPLAGRGAARARPGHAGRRPRPRGDHAPSAPTA